MNIEDGKQYRTGKGAVITIGGTTRDYPGWCWSIQGDWYERATGRAIGYGPTSKTRLENGKQVRVWEHFVREPSGDDLVAAEEGG